MTLVKVEDPPTPSQDPAVEVRAPLCALPPLTPMQQEDIEDRRLRRWLIKTGAAVGLFCVVVVVTAASVVGVKSGQIAGDGVIGKLIDFAQEFVPIINLVVGTGQ